MLSELHDQNKCGEFPTNEVEREQEETIVRVHQSQLRSLNIRKGYAEVTNIASRSREQAWEIFYLPIQNHVQTPSLIPVPTV